MLKLNILKPQTCFLSSMLSQKPAAYNYLDQTVSGINRFLSPQPVVLNSLPSCPGAHVTQQRRQPLRYSAAVLILLTKTRHLDKPNTGMSRPSSCPRSEGGLCVNEQQWLQNSNPECSRGEINTARREQSLACARLQRTV